ncbi:hypothetical protein M407DRAFT_245242 [Tulasnella calospora MUT 4182]|uniref:Uncharacterized protein n=1 Tax=Tulasnella calospora MUT 4182 TaxID=1051891 RepID=A0A0C3QCB7_9AGAM|nr:hypothetical protein M407DRAFT_245242 [Tulasnella calospora MUT 4182]
MTTSSSWRLHPYSQSPVSPHFVNAKKPSKGINPDEVVTWGTMVVSSPPPRVSDTLCHSRQPAQRHHPGLRG